MSKSFFSDDLLINSGQDINPIIESEVQAKGEVKLIVFVNAEDIKANAEFLEKIVSAVNLSKDDYALIPVQQGARINLFHAFNRLNCSKAMIFGDPRSYLGQNIQWIPYELILWDNRRVLCSHQLQEVAQNDQFKKFLWNGLKQLMDVN